MRARPTQPSPCARRVRALPTLFCHCKYGATDAVIPAKAGIQAGDRWPPRLRGGDDDGTYVPSWPGADPATHEAVVRKDVDTRNTSGHDGRAGPIVRSFPRKPESQGRGRRSRPAPGRTGIPSRAHGQTCHSARNRCDPRRMRAQPPKGVPGAIPSARSAGRRAAELSKMFIRPLRIGESKHFQKLSFWNNAFGFSRDERELHARSAGNRRKVNTG